LSAASAKLNYLAVLGLWFRPNQKQTNITILPKNTVITFFYIKKHQTM